MKKIMAIHAYGSKWEYNLFMVSDRIGERVDRLDRERKPCTYREAMRRISPSPVNTI
ncbi:MAG: hypothetical protein QW372_06675 [Nitrososphaerales archaeon]